ncbi:MAG: hypothetical protein Q9224_000582 [Gallowayella concinna]
MRRNVRASSAPLLTLESKLQDRDEQKSAGTNGTKDAKCNESQGDNDKHSKGIKEPAKCEYGPCSKWEHTEAESLMKKADKARDSNGETSCARENEDHEKGRMQHVPRSPGYPPFLPDDNSLGRLEFQASKRSMDELKEFARTTPPDRMATKPTFPEGKAMKELARTDSARRQRILEHIGGNGSNGSLPSKPLKRLFRLNRSVTTSDMAGEIVPRASMEIASKHSSGGRKYMKIAINPKMYELKNPSTYKVNFEESKPKGKSQKWIYRKSQVRMDLDADSSSNRGQVSHLSSDSSDYCRKVMEDYPHLILGNDICDPAKTATGQANNGYSPSKGIPKPELGIQDFAAATLAIAHARARSTSLGPASKSPERRVSQSRQRESPIRKHGIHFARQRTSSRGPYSVPIKFQLRPQRISVPKTPRTSLGEPITFRDTSAVSPVFRVVNGTAKDTSPVHPVENGTAKSSPAKSGSSVAEDGQSDAESGKIMNAQSLEFIQGQGAFAYHSGSSRKPPKPGPAPTRALPSLPEGHDNVTERSIKVENKTLLASDLPSACGSSPKQKPSKTPHKGHRYRLSPVKNNVPGDSRIHSGLTPSPEFTKEFPQPPRTVVPAVPGRTNESPSPPRYRDFDVHGVVTGPPFNVSNFGVPTASHQVGDDQKISNGVLVLPMSPGPASHTPAPACPVISTQRCKDTEKDHLYIPWHESRVERVKAIKARDMKGLRAQQQNAAAAERDNHKTDAAGEGTAQSHLHASPSITKQLSSSQLSSASGSEDPQILQQNKPEANKGDRRSSASTKNNFSPIILLAEQLPYTANDTHSTAPSTNSNFSNHLPQPPHTFKPDGFPSPQTQHPAIPYNPTTLNAFPNRTSSLSSNPQNHPSSSSFAPTMNHRTPTPSSTSLAQEYPPANHSHANFTPTINNSSDNASDIEARLEARIAAMEKKNLLLERAFLAVIDASAGFNLGLLGGAGGRESFGGVNGGL